MVEKNSPCPCGSGLKYKRCCLPKENLPPSSSDSPAEDHRGSFSFYLLPALMLLALAARLFYLYEISDNPFFDFPQIDALFHDNWAKQLSAGDWSGSAAGVFYKAPLYPYFMAGVYKIFGHRYLMLRLIQTIMGTANCYLIYLLGRAYFNRRVGCLAFLMAALYGTFIFFDGELEIAGLHIFLNMLFLLSLTKAEQAGKLSWYGVSGLLLGLSALAVPSILLLLPLILFWWCWRAGREGQPFLKPALLLTLATLLTVSPATWHNYRHGKGFVLISANGGLNFFLGNNLHADKTTAIRPGIVWNHFTAQPHVRAGRQVSKIEENDYWAAKSRKFVRNHPGRFLRLLLKKFGLFWQSHEIKRNRDLNFFRRYSRLLQLPLPGFGMVAPLALMGIGIGWSGQRKHYLLLLYMAAIMTAAVLFFMTARYRLPVVPVLIIFAASFLDWLWEKSGEGNYRLIGFAGLGLLFLGGLINYDFRELEKNANFARSHHNLGYVYYKQKDYEKAIREWNTAISLYGAGELGAVDTHYNLADVYNYQKQDYQKAVEHCKKGLRVLPDMAELETEMGWAYYRLNQKKKGMETLEKAIKSDSRYEKAYRKLGRIYLREKHWEKGRNIFKLAARNLSEEEKMKTLSQLTGFSIKEGLNMAKQRKWQAAENLFQIALESRPHSGSLHYNLGLVYLNDRSWKKAIKHLEQAARLSPAKGEYVGALGSAYLGRGQKDKARQMFERALEIDKTLEIARRQLKRLRTLSDFR